MTLIDKKTPIKQILRVANQITQLQDRAFYN